MTVERTPGDHEVYCMLLLVTMIPFFLGCLRIYSADPLLCTALSVFHFIIIYMTTVGASPTVIP
jgi:hypothetical protein